MVSMSQSIMDRQIRFICLINLRNFSDKKSITLTDTSF